MIKYEKMVNIHFSTLKKNSFINTYKSIKKIEYTIKRYSIKVQGGWVEGGEGYKPYF